MSDPAHMTARGAGAADGESSDRADGGATQDLHTTGRDRMQRAVRKGEAWSPAQRLSRRT